MKRIGWILGSALAALLGLLALVFGVRRQAEEVGTAQGQSAAEVQNVERMVEAARQDGDATPLRDDILSRVRRARKE